MVRLGIMELVLRTWEVGEPSALLKANDVPKAHRYDRRLRKMKELKHNLAWRHD